MARHNCRIWTSLGFNCPGGVLEARQQRVRVEAFEPDKGARMPRVIPVHDLPTKRPPELNRFIYIRIMRSIRRFLNIKKSQAENAREMASPRDVDIVHAKDIPIKDVLRSPIPEIAITGATAATIMLAERVFGARAEEWVANQVARQGRGRTTTTRSTRPNPVSTGGRSKGQSAGAGFRFNAAEDLRRRLLKSGRDGGGEFFPGILG